MTDHIIQAYWLYTYFFFLGGGEHETKKLFLKSNPSSDKSIEDFERKKN